MPACPITVETLAQALEQFLAQYPEAVLSEDGLALFDFAHAHYSVSGEGKCVLHVWSEERNIVRRVLDVEVCPDRITLQVLRFGQSHPNPLEIGAERDRGNGNRRRARLEYQKLLERVLRREYPGFRLDRLSTSPDLEHSFSPVYTRGVLRAGQSFWGVLGVCADEMQPSVDAALTFGVIWMDYLRQQWAGRAVVEGLKLFLPAGRSEIVRQRAAHLDASSAKWQIFELNERAETVEHFDTGDIGNIMTRLTRAVDRQSAHQRFAASIAQVRQYVPGAEVSIESASEIVFRLYGLEFARARIAPTSGSFRNRESILFGVGPAEYVLDDSTRPLFAELVQRLTAQRHPSGSHTNMFYRLAPERWLESLVIQQVRAIDERLDQHFVYSQVPAFAANDRAMLDVLTCTLDGRLAVLELKANEDIHLPLQGLDYWARVRWHQQHGEFTRNGYFAGRELSSSPPMLYLVAPALRVHPATDTLLRYLSPRIEWALVEVDERWREGVRVVNRKRAGRSSTTVFG